MRAAPVTKEVRPFSACLTPHLIVRSCDCYTAEAVLMQPSWPPPLQWLQAGASFGVIHGRGQKHRGLCMKCSGHVMLSCMRIALLLRSDLCAGMAQVQS